MLRRFTLEKQRDTTITWGHWGICCLPHWCYKLVHYPCKEGHLHPKRQATCMTNSNQEVIIIEIRAKRSFVKGLRLSWDQIGGYGGRTNSLRKKELRRDGSQREDDKRLRKHSILQDTKKQNSLLYWKRRARSNNNVRSMGKLTKEWLHEPNI